VRARACVCMIYYYRKLEITVKRISSLLTIEIIITVTIIKYHLIIMKS
jgi:hypothetical protein